MSAPDYAQYKLEDFSCAHGGVHRCENGVSAGQLYEIARALRTTPEYFFDGLAEQASPLLPPRQRLLLDLVRSLRDVERKEHWRALRDLIRALTGHMRRQISPRRSSS